MQQMRKVERSVSAVVLVNFNIEPIRLHYGVHLEQMFAFIIYSNTPKSTTNRQQSGDVRLVRKDCGHKVITLCDKPDPD